VPAGIEPQYDGQACYKTGFNTYSLFIPDQFVKSVTEALSIFQALHEKKCRLEGAKIVIINGQEVRLRLHRAFGLVIVTVEV